MKKPTIEKGTLCIGGGCHGPAERDADTGNIEQGPHVTARAAANGDIAVVSVDRSPMNARRWELSLSCGHSVWVTAKTRPRTKTAKCERCARATR